MPKQSFAGHGLRAIFTLLVVASGVLFVLRPPYLFSTRYYTKAMPYSLYIAARQGREDGPGAGGREQLLMLTTSAQVGWQGSRLESFYVPLGEALGFFKDSPSPLKARHELVRFANADDSDRESGRLDLKHVRIERRDAGALPTAGTLSAQGDELYYIGYAEAGLAEDDEAEEEEQASSYDKHGWRWDGKEFVSVPAEETAKIAEDKSRNPESRAQRAEAGSRGADNVWKVCSVSTFGGGGAERNNCAVTLSGEQWSFQIGATNASPNFEDIYKQETPFSLRARSESGHLSAAFIDDSGGWKEVSAAEYAGQQDARLLGIGGQYFGRLFTPVSGLRFLLPLFVFFGLYYALMRKAVNGSISPSRYYPEARPEDFPALDRARLDAYTADLEARGFVRLRDFTIVSPEGSVRQPPSFVRLFAHAQLKCYAEVGQFFTDKPCYDSLVRMHVSVLSHFAEPGWSLATTDRPPAPGTYALRKPRTLWQCRPGLSLDALISAHADVSRQMTITLALNTAADYAAETYFKIAEASITETRELVKRRTRFGLLRLMFESARDKTARHNEWLGDYGLRPAPSGWTPPPPAASPHRTGDDPYRQPARRSFATSEGWRRLVINWSDLISVFSTVCLSMTAYFWLVLPAPQHQGQLYFRLGMVLAGLLGQLVVWMAKRGRGTLP